MNVPSQRVADAINKINLDSCVWAYRNIIDETLTLLAKDDHIKSEIVAMLELGKKIGTDHMDMHASCLPPGMSK